MSRAGELPLGSRTIARHCESLSEGDRSIRAFRLLLGSLAAEIQAWPNIALSEHRIAGVSQQRGILRELRSWYRFEPAERIRTD